jgi:peptidoglycan/LPS O-acetylase OafA/YrhL
MVDRVRIRRIHLIIYYVIFITILLANWLFYYKQHKIIDLTAFPFLPLRQFVFAFICLVAVVSFTRITKSAVGLLSVFGRIAPISYSIYILHFPIWIQLRLPFVPVIEIMVKVLLLLGLSYLIEIVLQPKINKILK